MLVARDVLEPVPGAVQATVLRGGVVAQPVLQLQSPAAGNGAGPGIGPTGPAAVDWNKEKKHVAFDTNSSCRNKFPTWARSQIAEQVLV